MRLDVLWRPAAHPFRCYRWSRIHAAGDETPMAVVDDDGTVRGCLLVGDRAARNTACWSGLDPLVSLNWLAEQLIRRDVAAAYLRLEGDRIWNVGQADAPNCVVEAGWTASDMGSQWRRDVRRAERDAVVQIRSLVPDPDSPVMRRFVAMHGHTMQRADAAPIYRDGADYFCQVAASNEWTTEVVEVFDRRTGDHAGGVVMLSTPQVAVYGWGGGYAQHLRPLSPVKAALVAWARARDWKRIDLGGGLTAGDSLERFKKGMGAATEPRRILKAVMDRASYEAMCSDRLVDPHGSWFPPWRKTAVLGS